MPRHHEERYNSPRIEGNECMVAKIRSQTNTEIKNAPEYGAFRGG